VATSQFPIPVANAFPRARICIGIISAIYTHEIEPKEQENMTETQKRKNTPPIERPLFVPSGFWLLIAASQMRAIVMPMVPKIKGLRRPTRSRMKTINMKSLSFVSPLTKTRHLDTHLQEVRQHYICLQRGDWCSLLSLRRRT
jgi:hypothetical protein